MSRRACSARWRQLPTSGRDLDGAARPAGDPHPAEARQLAADLGVSTDAIAETIRVATLGDVGANLAKFNAGDRQIPIRVQTPESVPRRPSGMIEA